MALQYREDPDLEFLQDCEQDDLKTLANILIYEKPRKKRVTQALAKNSEYRRRRGNYKKVWFLIAAELQAFGGDTIANLVRGGRGIAYREILLDVCNKMGVKFKEKSKTEVIESKLQYYIIKQVLDEMSSIEKQHFVQKLKLNVKTTTTQGILAALPDAFRADGNVVLQANFLVAIFASSEILGTITTLGASSVFMRTLSRFAIAFAIANIIYTVPSVSGPNYEVLLPAIVYVAYLRQKMLNGAEAAID